MNSHQMAPRYKLVSDWSISELILVYSNLIGMWAGTLQTVKIKKNLKMFSVVKQNKSIAVYQSMRFLIDLNGSNARLF